MLAVWWTFVSSLPSWSCTEPHGDIDLEAIETTRSPGISKMSTRFSTIVSKRGTFCAGSNTAFSKTGMGTSNSWQGSKGFAFAGQVGDTFVSSLSFTMGTATAMVPSELGVTSGLSSAVIKTTMFRFASSPSGSFSASEVTMTCAVLLGACSVATGAGSATAVAAGAGSACFEAPARACGASCDRAAESTLAVWGDATAPSTASPPPMPFHGMNLLCASSSALLWCFSRRISSMSLHAPKLSGSR
mmetsp:Transcript_44349/g.102427  ORF Transcript_44349/g.102427 Transcript_44349/m.102427 type:complete len:245 (+) Transcript_44349:519-1253(+)